MRWVGSDGLMDGGLDVEDGWVDDGLIDVDGWCMGW